MSRTIVAIVLAAGASRRFGGDKLSAVLASGRSMLDETVTLYAAVCHRVVVVLRNNRAAADWQRHVVAVPNDRASFGMGASIARGVAAADDADGWLIALADMPFVRRETVCAIHAELAAHSGIVLPVYDGHDGHPVGFSSNFRKQLLSLGSAGDRGARQIVEQHVAAVRRVPVQDDGILRDIDTPEDLQLR